ncbi:helix-turn-helix transcriptional regulator [Clostridium sp. C2-6-12]|uniref:helix-turn-helix domain-containing protein n=1 Tax=Clostridium sp. C2-6-12 TaxID=2698832 RepID=UPI00136C0E5E|nr:helix-turn-helix transcriptional regulator [Clostridium sp. C2-6-12]
MKLTGTILKRLREKNNKTLEELVTEINDKYNIGLKVNELKKSESGKSEIRYDKLKCLALYYNVTTDFLLGFDLDEFVDIIDFRQDFEILQMVKESKERIAKRLKDCKIVMKNKA